jgi:metallo-beta-lactamase class B
MMNKSAALFLLLAILSASCASEKTQRLSPWAASNPDWIENFEPFKVYGPVYYVGTRGLSSFLIATPKGHFLIDGGLPENARIIAGNIKALGFDVREVKYLLNSHAHFDHSGGLAALKKMSGATMVASDGDAWALATGLVPGSENDPSFSAPPVKVDRAIADGESLTLGGVTITARLTPGHTKGCTTWVMNADGLEILFFCSATVAANRLVDPAQYGGIVEDYRATFAKAQRWTPDIFLANHPGFFNIGERRRRQQAGEQDAFVDRAAFSEHLASLQAAFEKALAEQMSKSQGE